jgi:hypothetical protein
MNKLSDQEDQRTFDQNLGAGIYVRKLMKNNSFSSYTQVIIYRYRSYNQHFIRLRRSKLYLADAAERSISGNPAAAWILQ